jgi:hypothetical protein
VPKCVHQNPSRKINRTLQRFELDVQLFKAAVPLQETSKPTHKIQGFFLNNFASFFLNREEEAAANPSPATSTAKKTVVVISYFKKGKR